MVNHIPFPDLCHASEDGLLTMGGDLSTDMLVSAYAQGIFPWFNEEQPILWWSPDPRLVIFPGEVKISKSLTKRIKQHRFTVTCNHAFDRVIKCCALRGVSPAHQIPSVDTWITREMREAYLRLNDQGYAHSIEVWHSEKLVGGLYGVALGKVFFGESMFSRESDASKIALVALSQWLLEKSFTVIDCQVASQHLFSMGAKEIPRDVFVNMLNDVDINSPLLNFSHGFEYIELRNAIKTI